MTDKAEVRKSCRKCGSYRIDCSCHKWVIVKSILGYEILNDHTKATRNIKYPIEVVAFAAYEREKQRADAAEAKLAANDGWEYANKMNEHRLTLSDKLDAAQAELKAMTEKFERNSIAAGDYSLKLEACEAELKRWKEKAIGYAQDFNIVNSELAQTQAELKRVSEESDGLVNILVKAEENCARIVNERDAERAKVKELDKDLHNAEMHVKDLIKERDAAKATIARWTTTALDDTTCE